MIENLSSDFLTVVFLTVPDTVLYPEPLPCLSGRTERPAVLNTLAGRSSGEAITGDTSASDLEEDIDDREFVTYSSQEPGSSQIRVYRKGLVVAGVGRLRSFLTQQLYRVRTARADTRSGQWLVRCSYKQ